ncbi:hypothetical protein ASE11_11670 [Hydrogenophaga sp. Root209]|nr:hypothetical protein ASE11_11670 [Hydrogenophaga sp. Root209]
MRNKHARTSRRPKRTAAMLGCAAFLSVLTVESWAQTVDQGAARATVWIEPSISVGATLSSNGNASSSNSRSQLSLEVTPSVRALLNTARVKGFVDYSLSALYYLQGNSSNRLSNRLNANGTLEVWDQRAFVDVSGMVSDQAVSAFGPQSVTSLSDTNRSETSSFRVSPYIRGSIGGAVDYQARYALQTLNTDTSSRSDSTSQVLSGRLGSRPVGQLLGWYLDASAQETDYTVGRDTSSDIARAGVIISVSPQLNVTLSAGVETNDVITLQRESYNITGAGFEWRPSLRTSLSVSAENRYFGTGYNVAFEHRTGRTVWRYVASRSASDSPTQSGSFSRGSVYDLLDALLDPRVTDPIERDRIIRTRLFELGLPDDAQVFQDFLSSSATLNRTQQLSVALSGIRSVVTFNVTRGSTSRLNSLSTLGDDFDSNDNIDQQSWGVNYAHRVTPLTSFNAAYLDQESVGSSGASSKRQSVSLGLSTRLAPRTNGIVQLRFGRFNNTAGSYSDTAISGRINHRF